MMQILLIFILLGLQVGLVQATTELPVRWTDYLILEDVADNPPKVPGDFRRVFNSDWLGPNVVQVDTSNSKGTITIGNCRQALANENNVNTTDKGLWGYLTSKFLTCKTYQHIEKMSPSKQSYVDDLTPKDFVKSLNETQLESKYSQVRNLFIGLHDKESIIRCDGNYDCKFKTLYNIYFLYILAYGDYDGDGIEDVLFRVRNDFREGTGFFRVALIGTKKSADAPFKIIKVIE